MPDKNDPNLDTTREREEAAPQRLGATVGAFAIAAVEADGLAKEMALVRTVKILQQPNVEWKAGVGALNGKRIGMAASIPAAALADLRTFAPDTGKLTFTMTTSETNKASQVDKVGGSFTASVKFGWGPVSASARFGGSASHSSEKSRTTDYSAKTEAELTFKQSDPPEGVALICGTINEVVRRGLTAVVGKAGDAVEEGAQTEELPPAPTGDELASDAGQKQEEAAPA